MARPPIESISARLSTDSFPRRRALRRGLIALAIGWLAWFYWFSRAALLAGASLAVAVVLYLAVRSAYRVARAGSDVYRQVWMRVLLSLVRRIV